MKAWAQTGRVRSRLRSPQFGTDTRYALVWMIPILVLALVYFSPRHVISANAAIAGLLGLFVVVLAARWPDRSLLVLIVLLPFQGFILSRLWAMGVPSSLVRHLAAWKETLALGIVVAGARSYVGSGRRADLIDKLALAFIAVAGLYLVAQSAIIPSAPAPSNIRLLGFREDAGFVILLLGARHAPLAPAFLDRAARAVLATGAVVAGICVFEAIASVGWNQFVVHTIKYTQYQLSVLGVKPQNFGDIRIYGTIGGTQIIRAGSVFLNALTCGFYLVLPFAIGLERIARGQAKPWVMVSLVLVGAGLLLTQTRSAILAALIVAFIVFQPAAGRNRHWRAQLGILVAALLVVAIPAAVVTGLAERVAASPTQADQSTSGHIAGFWRGIKVLRTHPLGQGLGTSAGTGERFENKLSDVVIPENNYLQFGAELGILPMLVFAALTVALVVRLQRAARRESKAVLVAAVSGAFTGLAVGAWFLQTWVDFSVAWTVWGLAGAALGVSARARLAGSRRSERPGHVDSSRVRIGAPGGRSRVGSPGGPHQG